MQYIVLGLCLLVGLALLARWFVTAKPESVRAVLPWIAGLLATGLAAVLLYRGGLSGLWSLAFFALPMILRWRNVLQTIRNVAKASRGPSPGQTSTVRTAWVAMTLDHDSGDMSGEVLKGPFAGRSLSSLSREALLDLLTDCSADDPQSAQLVESFLDRTHGPDNPGGDWRDGLAAKGRSSEGAGPNGAGATDAGTMTRSQALDVLGLSEGAAASEIREAHRRLMMTNHPDRGGSPFLAAQINRAKDILLGKA